MFTDSQSKIRERAAFTLIEVMTATAVATIVGVVIAGFIMFSVHSFASMANYTEMNQDSQLALDKMFKDIRQARQLTAYSSNSLSFLDVNSNSLKFTYSPSAGTLSRISSGQTTVLLSNCTSLGFWAFQPTLFSNTFTCYTPAVTNNARVIQVTWSCSGRYLRKEKATEKVESAEIVMRNH